MKRILFAVLSVFTFSVFAQKQITVDLAPQTRGKKDLAFVVEIPQAALKNVESDWLKYVGYGSKGKATEVDGEHLQKGAVNKNISSKPFNIYSKLLETTEGVRLMVWLDKRNTAFISKHPRSGLDYAVQKYVRDFAVMKYRQAVLTELIAEQDKLKELEEELAGFIREEERSVMTISDNERSTVRANDAIAVNNSDIKISSNKIYRQKEMVTYTASDSNATKGAQKTLSDLKTEKENLQKDNEAQGMSIDSRNKENRKEERRTTGSQQDQELKMAEIEKQKQRVQEVQTKVDNIQ